jgi:nucleoside phosphorylase
MKILIIEDDEQKQGEIFSYIETLGVATSNILLAKNMAEFLGKFDSEVTLCIIDLRLPAFHGGSQDNNGIGVLQAIDKAGASHVKLLAISAYPDEFANIRAQFESRGCLLLDFKQKEVWQGVLRQMVVEGQSIERLDFIIFCALRHERAPYTAMEQLTGSAKSKDNLTRFDITIAGRRGTIIEMPRMGLVDAAITAGQCIEKFKPKIVAMSGICAGFAKNAALGQLLVPELAYEYQSGKWTDEGFSGEPYQVPISETVRVLARELIEDTELLPRLEKHLKLKRPSEMNEPKLATFTSGSAVIASDQYMEQVATLHRRVSGLDMEVYAVHRAAHIASCKPDVICAKTVVDLAGGDKDDALQPYGCVISARFIVEALEAYFKN